MTVSATNAYSTGTGNGSATAFPFTFAAKTADEIVVLVDGAIVSPSLYAVTLNDSGGGTVTFVTAPSSGAAVLIASDPDFTQDIDFENNGAFLSDTHDEANDRAAIRDIWAKARLSALLSSFMLSPAVRAGKFLAWDADGLPVPSEGVGSDADLRNDLAADGGAELVGVIPAWSGSVATSLQSEIRALGARAEQAGALGTGAGNDAPALQAMLDSGDKRVRLTHGKTYRTTVSLTVPAGVWIEGNGATILAAHNAEALNFADGGGARDLTITGPDGSVYLDGSVGVLCEGTNNHPAVPTYVTAPSFENVTISGFGAYGIYLTYARNSASRNVVVHDCGYSGIGGASCEDITFNGVKIYDIGPGTVVGDAYGWFFDRADGTSETSDPRSYRCKLSNFTIRNVNATGGNGQGVDSHGGVDIQVTNGVIIDCDVGIAFTASSISGAQALGPIRCKAIGVSIAGDHTSYGLIMVGAVVAGTVIEYAQDCELDITIDGHGLDSVDVADGSAGATLIRATKNLRLRATLQENESCGIYLDQSNIGFDIDAIVTDPHSDNFTVPSCVRVAGNDNRGKISGVFRVEDTTLATYVAARALRIEAGLTGLGIEFGRCAFLHPSATAWGSGTAYVIGDLVSYRGVLWQAVLGGTNHVPPNETYWREFLTVQNLTTDGVNLDGMMTARGDSALVGASKDIVFAQRFPVAPTVLLTPTSDLNPVRVSAVTESGFTAAGTGTTAFNWRATT